MQRTKRQKELKVCSYISWILTHYWLCRYFHWIDISLYWNSFNIRPNPRSIRRGDRWAWTCQKVTKKTQEDLPKCAIITPVSLTTSTGIKTVQWLYQQNKNVHQILSKTTQEISHLLFGRSNIQTLYFLPTIQKHKSVLTRNINW